MVLNMQMISAGKSNETSSFSYDVHDGPTAFSIELAGTLAAEGANKLEQDWRDASAAIGNKELVVDLSFLTDIDPEGRRLLLRWFRNGATVVANTPESRALAESVIGHPLPPMARIAYSRTGGGRSFETCFRLLDCSYC